MEKVFYNGREIELRYGETAEIKNGALSITYNKKFRRGDILCDIDGSYPFIFSHFSTMNGCPVCFCGKDGEGNLIIHSDCFSQWTSDPVRQATEEERNEFIKFLEYNGKRWNPKTFELEDILKVGDVCIFWDSDKCEATIGTLDFSNSIDYPFSDNNDIWHKHAIKCESLEQYFNFIKQ